MVVADGELDAVQAASPQRAQELQPEGLGLDLTDVQADHLAHAVVVDGVGDHERLGHDTAAVTDLDVLGVQPQIRIGAGQRPLAELSDVLVEVAAQPADAVLAHRLDAELLDEAVDLARAHAVDVGLHHHADDRLLTAPPRLKEAREVRRPRPRPGDLKLDLTDPCLPRPLAIPVEVGHALGRPLAAPRARQLDDLGLHQLTHDQRHRLTQQVTVLAGHRARDDIGRGHHPVLGHRGAPTHRSRGKDRRAWTPRWSEPHGPTPTAPPTPLLPT